MSGQSVFRHALSSQSKAFETDIQLAHRITKNVFFILSCMLLSAQCKMPQNGLVMAILTSMSLNGSFLPSVLSKLQLDEAALMMVTL